MFHKILLMGVRRMAKLSVNWSRVRDTADLNPALIRYTRNLETKGFKKNTIILYTKLINNYLVEVNTDLPTPQDATDYRDSLHDKKLSGSAINNFTAAIINYHKMIGEPVKLPFLKLNNSLPYYFDETDILKIFSVCSNLKRYCSSRSYSSDAFEAASYVILMSQIMILMI